MLHIFQFIFLKLHLSSSEKKELTLSIILYPHQHAILLKLHAVIYGHI